MLCMKVLRAASCHKMHSVSVVRCVCRGSGVSDIVRGLVKGAEIVIDSTLNNYI